MNDEDDRYEISKESSDIESSKSVSVKGPDKDKTKELFDQVWNDE